MGLAGNARQAGTSRHGATGPSCGKVCRLSWSARQGTGVSVFVFHNSPTSATGDVPRLSSSGRLSRHQMLDRCRAADARPPRLLLSPRTRPTVPSRDGVR
jgi:hypothetical protein